MGLSEIPNNSQYYTTFNRMLDFLDDLNFNLKKIDLKRDINSFKHFRKFTPYKAIWFYKLSWKWMYFDFETKVKGLVNLNLRTSRDDVLNLSDADFEILEKLITEEQRKIVYKWKCEEYQL